ncbi:TRAP transporter small permease [Acetonema longum]|uniref:ABC transporter n=1 Tax=Acetonema longum DSM 6540 TaxID=1009370 RepID=F7NMM8_9FIRM|nr:TRAP transporter small permease [Acetonema longum]EGO62692.1 ABC transporter [Acetonema longum DSM 6540]
MDAIMNACYRMLHALIAVCLCLMTTFVFSNVVMRYFFNSGITWAEEASRYLFVWLIFLGAIVAFRENAHLGVDTLVNKLSVKGRKILFVANNILILLTMLLVVHGTWNLTTLTMDQNSPSMRIPLAFVYVAGFISSVSIVIIALGNLYKLLTNKMASDELLMITDSEDRQKIESVVGEEKSKGGPNS